MKSRQFAFKAAVALALVALILGLSASPASAGWPRRAVVVATPVVPAYVAAEPIATVYEAPVATVYAAPVTQVVAAPVVDTALVPTAFAAPVTTTYASPVVATTYASPVVATTYAAPALVAAPARVKVVYPRRVYRFGY